jgi:hypothetical protein
VDDPDLSAFLTDLSQAVLFHKFEGTADNFKRKYRREIIVFLSMLHHVGLFGSPTSYHPDPPKSCDLCGGSLAAWRWFVNGQHGPGAEWGNLCQACFINAGGSLGWGRGQLYLQMPDGRWLLVAGGAAPDAQTSKSIETAADEAMQALTELFGGGPRDGTLL